MLGILDRLDLPPALQVLLAAVGLLGLALSIFLIPSDIRKAVEQFPLLGESVPWWVILAVSVFLLGLVIFYQILVAPQPRRIGDGATATEHDVVVRNVKGFDFTDDGDIVVVGSMISTSDD